MKNTTRCLLLFIILVFCFSVHDTGAQPIPSAHDGWQGPRPALQRPPAVSIPQMPPMLPPRQDDRSHGKQVLEIPPQPQQPTLATPTQQHQVLPSLVHPQPPSQRPSQLLTVTVTDQEGRYVSDLRPEDFLLYEEELPQPLSYFNRGQNEPMSLGLVVDVSASMGNKLRQARQAVQRLAATIQAQDEVFLLAFSHRPGLLQDFTDSRALIVQATAQLQPDGGTALYDAILDGLQRMKTARRQKKALVVITDGLDTGSQASLEQVAATVRKADILVYTIGIGNPNGNVMRPHGGMGGRPYFGGMGGMSSGVFPHLGQGPIPPTRPQINEDTVDSRLLIMLSEETGAKHFLLNTADVLGQRAILENAAETIVMELRGQYSLGYRSALKGDIRRDVRVETRRPDLVVRTQAHPAGMQRTN